MEAKITLVGRGKDADGWERDEWDVVLMHHGRDMRTKFYTGTAHPTPTMDDVLESLFSEADGIAYSSVDEWIEEFGFEIKNLSDARKLEAQYAQIERQSEELRRLLGAEYDLHRDRIEELNA